MLAVEEDEPLSSKTEPIVKFKSLGARKLLPAIPSTSSQKTPKKRAAFSEPEEDYKKVRKGFSPTLITPTIKLKVLPIPASATKTDKCSVSVRDIKQNCKPSKVTNKKSGKARYSETLPTVGISTRRGTTLKSFDIEEQSLKSISSKSKNIKKAKVKAIDSKKISAIIKKSPKVVLTRISYTDTKSKNKKKFPLQKGTININNKENQASTQSKKHQIATSLNSSKVKVKSFKQESTKSKKKYIAAKTNKSSSKNNLKNNKKELRRPLLKIKMISKRTVNAKRSEKRYSSPVNMVKKKVVQNGNVKKPGISKAKAALNKKKFLIAKNAKTRRNLEDYFPLIRKYRHLLPEEQPVIRLTRLKFNASHHTGEKFRLPSDVDLFRDSAALYGLLGLIFNNLDLKSKLAASSCCRLWNRASKEDQPWQILPLSNIIIHDAKPLERLILKRETKHVILDGVETVGKALDYEFCRLSSIKSLTIKNVIDTSVVNRFLIACNELENINLESETNLTTINNATIYLKRVYADSVKISENENYLLRKWSDLEILKVNSFDSTYYDKMGLLLSLKHLNIKELNVTPQIGHFFENIPNVEYLEFKPEYDGISFADGNKAIVESLKHCPSLKRLIWINIEEIEIKLEKPEVSKKEEIIDMKNEDDEPIVNPENSMEIDSDIIQPCFNEIKNDKKDDTDSKNIDDSMESNKIEANPVEAAEDCKNTQVLEQRPESPRNLETITSSETVEERILENVTHNENQVFEEKSDSEQMVKTMLEPVTENVQKQRNKEVSVSREIEEASLEQVTENAEKQSEQENPGDISKKLGDIVENDITMIDISETAEKLASGTIHKIDEAEIKPDPKEVEKQNEEKAISEKSNDHDADIVDNTDLCSEEDIDMESMDDDKKDEIKISPIITQKIDNLQLLAFRAYLKSSLPECEVSFKTIKVYKYID